VILVLKLEPPINAHLALPTTTSLDPAVPLAHQAFQKLAQLPPLLVMLAKMPTARPVAHSSSEPAQSVTTVLLGIQLPRNARHALILAVKLALLLVPANVLLALQDTFLMAAFASFVIVAAANVAPENALLAIPTITSNLLILVPSVLKKPMLKMAMSLLLAKTATKEALVLAKHALMALQDHAVHARLVTLILASVKLVKTLIVLLAVVQAQMFA